MNIRPKNYSWPALYEQVISLTKHTFSLKAMARRVAATNAFIPRWMNLVRAVSTEGYGRIRYYSAILHRLQTDPSFRAYFEQQTDALPAFYPDKVRRDLGFMWHWLPEGALHHDQNAYLHAQTDEGKAGLAAERRVA
jgi:hypothetical protein